MKHSSIKYLPQAQEKYYLKEYEEILRQSPGVKHLEALLLDSSLKSRTIPKIQYDIKCITCGKYKQIFRKNYSTTRELDGWENNKKEIKKNKVEKILQSIDEDNIYNLNTDIKKEPSLKEIEEKNIIRSKNNMCRLILSNEDQFKTFITLTFKENIKDIEKSNYEFQKFIRKIKRAFPSLIYIAVPEFQKNDKIHYHLITNIDYNNDFLINENISLKKLYQIKGENANLDEFKEENIILNDNEHMNDREVVLRLQNGVYHNTKKTFNHKTKSLKIFKTIKFWQNGFSNVMELNGLCQGNIAGYMAKYMMKDLDNRLFGKKRYFYSQNVIKPQISYLDSSNDIDKMIFSLDLQNSEVKFFKRYKDVFNNEIDFIELKSDNDFIDVLKK